MSFLQVEGQGVALSAIKAYPQGMIVRVYEAEGQAVDEAALELAWPLPTPGARLSFALRPFEIKTFRLVLSA